MLKTRDNHLLSWTERMGLLRLVAIILVVHFSYVFFLTQYRGNMLGESRELFQAALLLGTTDTALDPASLRFPSLAIWILSLALNFLSLLGSIDFMLPLLLLLNIGMSGAGVALLYFVVRRLTGQRNLATLGAVVYGLHFPIIYLNTWVYHQAFTQFFVLLFLFLLVVPRSSLLRGFGSGVISAVCLTLYPPFFLFCALAIPYLYFSTEVARVRSYSLLFYVLGFALAIGGLSALSHSVYDGKTSNPYHGWYTELFLKQCKFSKAVFAKDHSPVVFESRAKVIPEEIAYYESALGVNSPHEFRQMAKECISANSNFVKENFSTLRFMFLGTMSPQKKLNKRKMAPIGYEVFFPIAQVVFLSGFLLALLSPFLTYGRPDFWIVVSLIVGITFALNAVALTSYDHRNVLALYPFVILAVLFGYEACKEQGERAGRRIGRGSVVLVLIFGALWQWGVFDKDPSPLKEPIERVHRRVAQGSYWSEPGRYRLFSNGMIISFRLIVRPPILELSLDSNDIYLIEYWLYGSLLHRQLVGPDHLPDGGIAEYRVPTPSVVQQYGMTHIKVVPVAGDSRYSLGHVGFHYSLPQTELHVSQTELNSFVFEGVDWNAPGSIVFTYPGLKVSLGLSAVFPKRIRIGMDHNDLYRLQYWKGTHLIAEDFLGPNLNIERGIAVYERVVPSVVSSLGVTHLFIQPLQGDGFFSLGGLSFSGGEPGKATDGEGKALDDKQIQIIHDPNKAE